MISWCLWREHQAPALKNIYAIPNGGKRGKAAAGKMKAEGQRAGMPDLCLPVALLGYHALYIEVKTPKGRASPIQKEVIERLRNQGNAVAVVRSLEAFIILVDTYLDGVELKSYLSGY